MLDDYVMSSKSIPEMLPITVSVEVEEVSLDLSRLSCIPRIRSSYVFTSNIYILNESVIQRTDHVNDNLRHFLKI